MSLVLAIGSLVSGFSGFFGFTEELGQHVSGWVRFPVLAIYRQLVGGASGGAVEEETGEVV